MSRMLDAMSRLLPGRAQRPEGKASAVGPLIAWDPPGQPVWSPRDYSAFAREGFMQNAIPLLPEARVAAMKARRFEKALPTEREFERWLTRDAGLTRSEARAVMGAGFFGLKALRDAGRGISEGTSEEAALASRIRDAARFLRCNH